MAIHELKVWTAYVEALQTGDKPFEVRRDDRGFQKGDTLILKEFDPQTQQYGPWSAAYLITYVLGGGRFGIEPGFAVLGLAERAEPFMPDCADRNPMAHSLQAIARHHG